MSPFPRHHHRPPTPPRGGSWSVPGMLTCSSERPVLGAHEAPHGVISGVAVLPVEAVPASCGHSHHLRVQCRVDPHPHPATSAPRTHLPETVAIAGCPWIPSGSSCKGSGRSGRSAGAAGGPSSRKEGVIPPVAGRARTARGRQRPGPRRARPARPASPGRWRSRGGEGRRGVVWSVENPHGPPRERPAVTSALAAGRGWGGLRWGSGSSWDAQWRLESEKHSRWRSVRGAGALG